MAWQVFPYGCSSETVCTHRDRLSLLGFAYLSYPWKPQPCLHAEHQAPSQGPCCPGVKPPFCKERSTVPKWLWVEKSPQPAPLPLQTEPRWGEAEAELGDCIGIIESSPQHLLEGAGVWASERVTVLGCSRCKARAYVFLGCRLSQVRDCTDVCRKSLLGLLRMLWV